MKSVPPRMRMAGLESVRGYSTIIETGMVASLLSIIILYQAK